MKKLILVAGLSATFIFSDCGASRQVQRIDPNQVVDISGRWNDTDSKLVADEMIKDVLDRPWRTNFERDKGKRPTVIVGSIKNKTSEHIDATAFIKNMERSFINSGTVSVVQSGDARNEARDERNDQQTFADEATRKRWGKEKGADFILSGVITSIVDEYKKQRVVSYQINLELTDLETNEKVWLGEKQIKKYIKN
ncbi:MAG: penicillin-binding protein activator LpoB [Bacteroidia bacterium]|nr:penicillin-binding protein activator LpoB [Bacteroidia bacterium]